MDGEVANKQAQLLLKQMHFDYQEIAKTLSEITSEEINKITLQISQQLRQIKALTSIEGVTLEQTTLQELMDKNTEIMSQVVNEKESILKHIRQMDDAKKYE
ncbi:MAG: hypothetical protein HOI53_01520 [Francisellaceae bacterium]|nr:hypothetical protein [Francisellaceae bacterium]MBT6539065.1 hypothetical protein [Francisellaceae bacterium]